MSTHTLDRPATSGSARSVASSTRHLTWLLGGFVIAFLTPYLLADTLEVQRDLYYALYGGIAVAYAAAWARDTGQGWLSWSVAAGA